MTINLDGKIVIRLVGGPAEGSVFAVPADKVPSFIAVGHPVARYQNEPGDGIVRIFRYVATE
jgi:hypothetical protein